MESLQRPIVSMIAIRQVSGGQQILLQRRTKDEDDTPYRGYLELPQGKIRKGESVQDAAARELIEETGLAISRYKIGNEAFYSQKEEASDLHVSSPIVCVADRIQNHLAIAVVVEVKGETSDTDEAEGHAWLGLSAIQRHIVNGDIFPLNIPMLEVFIKLQN